MEMSRFVSNHILRERLSLANDEERLALTRILSPEATIPLDAPELQRRICIFSGHTVGNIVRAGEGISYKKLLHATAEKVGPPKPKTSFVSRISQGLANLAKEQPEPESSYSEYVSSPASSRQREIDQIDALELKILSQLVQNLYLHGTPEQRILIERELVRLGAIQSDKNLSKLGTAGVVLAIGNLGGFATYTLMSTVLSTVSLGALGFGAYVFASSILSIALGPAGWLALAAYGIKKLGDPDQSRVAQLGITCAMISQRLKSVAV